MSTESEHVSILRQAYAEWAGKNGEDCACWLDLVADDSSLTSLGDGAPELTFTAPRKSRDEIRQYLDGLRRDWEMVSHEMNDFIAEGDRVVVIGRVAWRNRTTGKVADTPKLDVWRFRDGKAVDFVEFYDTARTIAAATP